MNNSKTSYNSSNNSNSSNKINNYEKTNSPLIMKKTHISAQWAKY